jgi:hypothetical protein
MPNKFAIRNPKSDIPHRNPQSELPLIVVTLSLFLTLVALRSAGEAQETKGQLVKVEYDSNKDITQISLNPFILASRKHEELRLGAIAAYKGKVRVRPAEVTLIFLSLSASDTSKYESARKLTVTADGQHLALGEARYSKQAQNGLFVESLMIAIPIDVFLRVCGSKDVTMKIGFTEIELSPKQIEILRIAASYMTE